MRRRRTKPAVAGQTSKLEEKLEELVTILKSNVQGAPGVINNACLSTTSQCAAQSSYDNAYNSTVEYEEGASVNSRRSLGGRETVQPSSTPVTFTSSESASTSMQHIMPLSALRPGVEDAESFLDKFRTDFVKHLPFVVISPTLTSRELQQERPILWLCIMAVASSSATQQIALSKEVRATIGREAFVEGTKNMDILLAILVFAAW